MRFSFTRQMWKNGLKQLSSFSEALIQSVRSVKRVESLSRTTTFITKNVFIYWNSITLAGVALFQDQNISIVKERWVDCADKSLLCCSLAWSCGSFPVLLWRYHTAPQSLCLFSLFTPFGLHHWFYLPASQSCQCFQPPAQLFLAL